MVPARETWTNVTPNGVDLVNMLSCENYGSITIVAEAARPSDLFTQFHCQGVWKSVDYGLTWSGPINTGRGGAGASGAGGLAIARGPDGQPQILYSAGIRGTGVGFWKSTDGGVSWTIEWCLVVIDRISIPPSLIPMIQIIAHDRAPVELDCSELGRRTELIRSADRWRHETRRRLGFHLFY
jgi:hypothetical protein